MIEKNSRSGWTFVGKEKYHISLYLHIQNYLREKPLRVGGGGIYICTSMSVGVFSSHADELEPVGTTIFLEEEFLAVGEAAGFAAFAFGRVGAVEIGYVLVADVAEPGGWEEVRTRGRGKDGYCF